MNRLWNSAKAVLGSEPDFLIVGTQKGGTTSLYRYLLQHPDVAPASKKEIQYFSDQYQRGRGWYRQHFPSKLDTYHARFVRRQPRITGEATPHYLFHPHAPRRIRAALPDVKIIVMLRDPVARAYSHYRFHLRLGDEALSFEEAIAVEPKRLAGELEKMLQDDRYESVPRKTYSYLARGRYLEQLERWMPLFPKDQFLFLCSEEFFENPARSYQQTLDFLGLSAYEPSTYSADNAGAYPPMSPETRQQLRDHFRPLNQRLYERLDRDFGWDR